MDQLVYCVLLTVSMMKRILLILHCGSQLRRTTTRCFGRDQWRRHDFHKGVRNRLSSGKGVQYAMYTHKYQLWPYKYSVFFQWRTPSVTLTGVCEITRSGILTLKYEYVRNKGNLINLLFGLTPAMTGGSRYVTPYRLTRFCIQGTQRVLLLPSNA